LTTSLFDAFLLPLQAADRLAQALGVKAVVLVR